MAVTTPLAAILADVAYACHQFPGWKPRNLPAGSRPAATSAAPAIRNLLISLIHWGRKP
jgi:hypothetical protein